MREQGGFADDVVMEGVVDQPERIGGADRVDRLDGLALRAERALGKAQGLGEADQAGCTKHRCGSAMLGGSRGRSRRSCRRSTRAGEVFPPMLPMITTAPTTTA